MSPVKTRAEQVAKIVGNAPVSMRGILERAFAGEAGRTNAIKAMCLVCTSFDRETVRDCTGWSCPLWKWRPFQSKAKAGPKSLSVEPLEGA